MGIRIYGTTQDSEMLQESAIVREIVTKILDYGISQKQMLFIIHDLALNLEDRDSMKRIINLVKDIQGRGLEIVNKSPLEV